jgi:cytochrome c oxidase assembly factor CtaG
MIASIVAYMTGYLPLRGRGSTRTRSVSVRNAHLIAFAGGWVQHESVRIGARLVLAAGRARRRAVFRPHGIGRPLGVWIWTLPRRARLRVGRCARAHAFARCWRALTLPVTAWMLHAPALWAWHAPLLFQAALVHQWVHSLQHASFLLSALLFWWTIAGDGARRRTDGHAMLSLFTTMVHTGALGALFTLAPGLWYPLYVEPCSALGVDPLRDQQLGGLIMWVPAASAYLIGALVIAARWLRRRDTPALTTGHAVIVPRDSVR